MQKINCITILNEIQYDHFQKQLAKPTFAYNLYDMIL